jgi:DNA-binding NarL/FixJ family response regulator
LGVFLVARLMRAAVLALRADGLVPGVIADKLGVSDATVRRHLKAA